MRAKPRHLESIEQRALIQWAQLQQKRIPELAMLFAIPNGGARSKIEAAIMKGEGVRAGVPDLMLAVPRDRFHGLFIEMKAPGRGADVSPEQSRWITLLCAHGYCAIVAPGWISAAKVITDYLGVKV